MREKSKEDIKVKGCFVIIISKENLPTSMAKIPPNPPEMKDFAELVVCFCCTSYVLPMVSIDPIRYIYILVTYSRSADRVQKEKVRSKGRMVVAWVYRLLSSSELWGECRNEERNRTGN